ncbi:hypothetical protein [Peribacillus muralis]|uniref:hypothetical protein n=1 Tax=Peribacillus muralis TaxID=264697 RepID=UPI003D089405
MSKMTVYPLFVIIGACSYGVVSTIITLSMLDGFSASEAVTSQFVMGFIGILTGMANISYGLSLNYMPASLAVVLLFQFTWIGMLISCIAKRQFPGRTEYFSIFLLFVGAFQQLA